MNSNEIDEIFEAGVEFDWAKIVEIYARHMGEKDTSQYKDIKLLCEKIMHEIENGDFEYFMEKYSKNKDDRYIDFFIELFSCSKNTTAIKNYIENIPKDLTLFPSEKIKLLKATKDSNYIKSFIEDKEKRKKIGLENSFSYIEIVRIIKDPEYTNKVLGNKKLLHELGLTPSEIRILVIDTKDQEYIKTVIESKGKNIGYNFDKNEIKNLVIGTEDQEYIKAAIENKGKNIGCVFGKNEIKDLVIGTKDSEYIKTVIESKGKNISCVFGKNEIKDFIFEMRDKDYITDIINNPEKLSDLGFNKKEFMELLVETSDAERINDFLKTLEVPKKTINKNRVINLPENMTIGVEIESEGKYSELIESTMDKFCEGWTCKGDGSLNKGVEVVSPVLNGDTIKSTESIKTVCQRLNNLRTKSF